MAKITKVIGFENKGAYALVTVQLDDGTEAVIYNGGQVEVYFAYGRISAFVRKKPLDKTITAMVD